MRIVADANGRPAPAPLGTGLTRVQASLPLRLTLAGSVLSGSVDTMTGATASTDGLAGAVPPPQAGEEGYVLTGEGTWQPVPTLSYSVAVPDDSAATQTAMSISVDGDPAEAKLGSRNGDLVIRDGALDIASFGGGNGGSILGVPIFPKQARFQGHVYQEVDLTTFLTDPPNTPQEAVRIIAKSHKTDASQSAAINITNATDGTDIIQPGVYHAIQINVAAAADDADAELGGIVCFLQQRGISTTSVVAFDGSVQTMNDADGPCASLVGLNIGVKQDNLGDNAGGCGQAIGTYVRQSGVGTSGHFGPANGRNTAHLVDRPAYWDYATGTIRASVGTTVLGAGTTWTSVPKTGEAGVCSLLGKWITWTAGAVVVSKRILSVTSDTELEVSEAIASGEDVVAGTAYKILATDPWDAIIAASGIGPLTAIDLAPETGIAPSRFTGTMAVQTAMPGTPATKFGWTWDGVARFAGLKTVQASRQPPFVVTRQGATAATGIADTDPGGVKDITGATVTITPAVNCRVMIHMSADLSYVSGAGVAVIRTLVNGAALPAEILGTQWGAGARFTNATFNTTDLTAGVAYTIKLEGSVVGAGAYSVAQTHTGLSIIAVGSA